MTTDHTIATQWVHLGLYAAFVEHADKLREWVRGIQVAMSGDGDWGSMVAVITEYDKARAEVEPAHRAGHELMLEIKELRKMRDAKPECPQGNPNCKCTDEVHQKLLRDTQAQETPVATEKEPGQVATAVRSDVHERCVAALKRTLADSEARALDVAVHSVIDAAGLSFDDPEDDGTDAAHPAWWRGHKRGCDGTAAVVLEILRSGLSGKFLSSPTLEEVAAEVEKLREELARTKLDFTNACDVGRRAEKLIRELEAERDLASKERIRATNELADPPAPVERKDGPMGSYYQARAAIDAAKQEKHTDQAELRPPAPSADDVGVPAVAPMRHSGHLVCRGTYGNNGCGWEGKPAELMPSGCCPVCGGGYNQAKTDSPTVERPAEGIADGTNKLLAVRCMPLEPHDALAARVGKLTERVETIASCFAELLTALRVEAMRDGVTENEFSERLSLIRRRLEQSARGEKP